MSTAVETDTSLEAIEALDFQPEFPCEWYGHGAPAQWLSIHLCCGWNVPYCNEHKERSEEWFKDNRDHAQCRRCGVIGIGTRYERIAK